MSWSAMSIRVSGRVSPIWHPTRWRSSRAAPMVGCATPTASSSGSTSAPSPSRKRGPPPVTAGAVAGHLLADNDGPVDHPDPEPMWQAGAEHDLAIVHHSFTWSPPYFPGYQDMWDNVYLARLCSHPGGAMRFRAGFLAGGVLDRHPGLRLCVLECGCAWLPFWVRRLDAQVSYGRPPADMKHLPSEHFGAGP